jgi:prevent-host-death family protein
MKTQKIGAFQAKTHLSALLERVDRGQVFVITRRGRAVAELRPVSQAAGLRFGADAGTITMAEDFDAPLDEFRDYTE